MREMKSFAQELNHPYYVLIVSLTQQELQHQVEVKIFQANLYLASQSCSTHQILYRENEKDTKLPHMWGTNRRQSNATEDKHRIPPNFLKFAQNLS